MSGSRRVAILQSNYIPWKGYFDIIHDVDHFIFYDDVQFTFRDWRNRNRIKTPQGLQWLTVPVGGSRNRRICDVLIPDDSWQKRHWRSLLHNYGRAKHFDRYGDWLESIYLGRRWQRLSEMNQTLIRDISINHLGITAEFDDAEHHAASGRKQERLIGLLQRCGATSYVTGPSARAYIDPQGFADAGIELLWKEYGPYPEYPQGDLPFEHGVSVLDLMFHTGPDAAAYIWGWRR